MHSQLLSIHFYYAQALFLAPDIPLTPNALFTLSSHPIRGLPLGLTPLTLYLVIFTKCSSSILSTCPNHSNTPWNILHSSPDPFMLPHIILLRNLISITFNLFLSAAPIFQVSAPYSAVGTTTPSLHSCQVIYT